MKRKGGKVSVKELQMQTNRFLVQRQFLQGIIVALDKELSSDSRLPLVVSCWYAIDGISSIYV